MRCVSVALASLLALASACGGGDEEPAVPAPAATVAATATPAAAATVSTPSPAPNATTFGTIRIEFLRYGEGAVLPDPRIRPLQITMMIQSMEDGGMGGYDIADPNPVGELVRDEYSVAALDFALELAPGVYQLRGLTASHRDLGSSPVELVLQSRQFTVSASGCVYVGRIVARYYRLPPGDLDSQVMLVGELIPPGEQVRWTPLELGGLVPESGTTEVPPEGEWPRGAESCVLGPAQWLPEFR